jgi:uncharacterized protein (TIGR02678 family)
MSSGANTDDLPTEEPSEARKARKRWLPEASAETAAALRRLAVKPWLISGRDDADIAAVRRNLEAVRETLARLGWVLVVERDFIRLRKSPPLRRAAWSAEGPTPLQCSWFFLLVGGAETVAPRVALAQLVNAARAAAAEAKLPVTHDISERRAIVHALQMLDRRGVVMQVDGDVEGFVDDENAPVLLAVHHSRLAHVIAHFGRADPTNEPQLWLEQVEREPDPARRMRQKLIDDSLVHVADLSEAEADWLSRRVRGDDGGPLASAFGLHLERRSEGASFVLPDGAYRYPHELGPTPFPGPGTVPHAALLLIEHVASVGEVSGTDSGPGPGWRGLSESNVKNHLATLAGAQVSGQGGWRRELAENPTQLAQEVRQLLFSLDLVRFDVKRGSDAMWWFSPATGRWLSGSAHVG